MSNVCFHDSQKKKRRVSTILRCYKLYYLPMGKQHTTSCSCSHAATLEYLFGDIK